MPAANERFGGRRGVGSWDTLQVFGSSPPVQAFVNPRPPAKPPGVVCKQTAKFSGDLTWCTLTTLRNIQGTLTRLDSFAL